MIISQEQICVALLFGTFFVTSVDAAESKDYQKIIEPGFAHLTCAAYGMLMGDDRYKKSTQRSFSRGSFLLAEWLIDMRSGKAPIASVGFAPKGIRLVPVPVSTLNFHLGYIWAQVELEALRKSTIKSNGYVFCLAQSSMQAFEPKLKNSFRPLNVKRLNRLNHG